MTVQERTQCISLTKKGLQCKLYALPNEKVCHVHIKYQNDTRNKNNSSVKTATSKQKNSNYNYNNNLGKVKNYKYENYEKNLSEIDEKPGHIYVFTYAHMMYSTPTEKSYLHLAAPTNTRGIDYNRTTPFDTSDKILIKVGYTRKSPEIRVNEWREQCGHSEFILLYPGCLVPTYQNLENKKKQKITLLSKMMSKLSLSNNRKRNDDKEILLNRQHTGRKYTGLNSTKTCFVSNNPYQVEQNIHRILRGRYGYGKMFCEGCSRQKIDSNKNTVKTLGIHTEWFLIPRNEMGIVWEVINEQCNSLSNTRFFKT